MRKIHLFDTNQGKKFTNQSSPPKTRPKRSISSTKKMVVDSSNVWGQLLKWWVSPTTHGLFPYMKMISILGWFKLGVYTHHFFRKKHPSYQSSIFRGGHVGFFGGAKNLRFTPIFFHIFLTTGYWALGPKKFASCPELVVITFRLEMHGVIFSGDSTSHRHHKFEKKTSDCLPSFLGGFSLWS